MLNRESDKPSPFRILNPSNQMSERPSTACRLVRTVSNSSYQSAYRCYQTLVRRYSSGQVEMSNLLKNCYVTLLKNYYCKLQHLYTQFRRAKDNLETTIKHMHKYKILMLNLINNDQLIMEQYKTHMPILNDYDITQLERIAHLLQHCYPDHLCHSCKTSIGNLDLVGLDLACFSDCSEVDNVASTNSSSHEVLYPTTGYSLNNHRTNWKSHDIQSVLTTNHNGINIHYNNNVNHYTQGNHPGNHQGNNYTLSNQYYDHQTQNNNNYKIHSNNCQQGNCRISYGHDQSNHQLGHSNYVGVGNYHIAANYHTNGHTGHAGQNNNSISQFLHSSASNNFNQTCIRNPYRSGYKKTMEDKLVLELESKLTDAMTKLQYAKDKTLEAEKKVNKVDNENQGLLRNILKLQGQISTLQHYKSILYTKYTHQKIQCDQLRMSKSQPVLINQRGDTDRPRYKTKTLESKLYRETKLRTKQDILLQNDNYEIMRRHLYQLNSKYKNKYY